MGEVKVVKAVEMERVLCMKKGENQIEVKGNLSNYELTKFIEMLLKNGWEPIERII